MFLTFLVWFREIFRLRLQRFLGNVQDSFLRLSIQMVFLFYIIADEIDWLHVIGGQHYYYWKKRGSISNRSNKALVNFIYPEEKNYNQKIKLLDWINNMLCIYANTIWKYTHGLQDGFFLNPNRRNSEKSFIKICCNYAGREFNVIYVSTCKELDLAF